MTKITGIAISPSDRDIFIRGTTGDITVEPILVDEFATALRIGSQFWMSLDPIGSMVRHKLSFGPPVLDNTNFLAGLTRADYFIKAMAVRAVESPVPQSNAVNQLMACLSQGILEVPAESAQNNVYLVPGEFIWEVSDRESLIHFELRSAPVVLVAGANAGEFQEDFSRGVNEHWAEIRSAHPRVFKRLENLYALHQISFVIRHLSRKLPFDLSYWLQDYTLEKKSVPAQFPGFQPVRYARFCPRIGERYLDISGGAVSYWASPSFPAAGLISGTFASSLGVIDLHPDGTFVQVSRGGAMVRGRYSWDSARTLRLEASNTTAILTWRDKSILIDPDGISWEDIFGELRRGVREGNPVYPRAMDLNEEASVDVVGVVSQMPHSLRQEMRVSGSLKGILEEDPTVEAVAAALHEGRTTDAVREVELLLAVDESKRHQLVLALERAIMTRTEVGDLSTAMRLAEATADLFRKALPDDPLGYAGALRVIAQQHLAARRFGAALESVNLSLAMVQESVGSDHPEFAEGLRLQAMIYSRTGEYRKADVVFKKAGEIFQEVDEGSLGHVMFLLAIGEHATRLADYEQALASYRRACDLLGRLESATVALKAEALGAIAWVLSEQGKLDEAERVIHDALALVRPEDRLLRRALSSIAAGISYYMSFYERSARITEDLLAEDETSWALNNNLGLIYWRLGRKKEADAAFARAVELIAEVVTEAFGEQPRVYTNYGVFLAFARRYERASDLLNRALLVADEVLGSTHPDSLAALEALALLSRLRGRWKEARAFERRLLTLRREAERDGDGVEFSDIVRILEALYRDGAAKSF